MRIISSCRNSQAVFSLINVGGGQGLYISRRGLLLESQMSQCRSPNTNCRPQLRGHFFCVETKSK